jgi:hypothetical protein
VIGPLLACALALASATDDDWEESRWEEPIRHLQLTAWGGGSILLDQSGAASPWLGAELGWSFPDVGLSAMFEEHRYGRDLASRTWTPVAVARLEQRFETRRGLDGTLVVGLGAGKPETSWIFWYQLAIGVRVGGDPFFLRAEVGFERDNFLRLGAALGLAF